MFERKIYGHRVRLFTEKMESVLYDAYLRMDRERESVGLPHPTADEVNIFSWPQTWPDAGAPTGGEGKGEGPVTTQTNVVKDERTGTVYVYHAGRFVRRIERPGATFWAAVGRHELPGAADEEGWAKLTA